MKRTCIVGLILILVTSGRAAAPDGDYLLKVNKSIDLFGKVYREIAAHYVDQVDPEKFMAAGIEGMLGSLDPYTVYIDRDDEGDVDLLTTGRYGGIGITIGLRDSTIQVLTVMDGYSAQKEGIVPGDRILSVNGVQVRSKRPNDVRNLTRGDPGTDVTITIEREGEPSPMEFVLTREEILLKNVTYASFVEDGIGYIKLERFSRRAGEDVRQAIKDLKLRGELDGLVLDVRGNPGGLLDAAVEVVSKFVPRGSLIVSTMGRQSESRKPYSSTEEPLLAETPLIVLVDRGSASASEIVSGALQDLDRALIVGTRTFGKGLVQTIRDLPYDAKLKLTTARYYIPSGRSIQEIDYMHRDKNGVFVTVPDSLKREFTTKLGRKVYEYGGITPDSVVEEPDPGPMIRELLRRSLFLRFVNVYATGQEKDTVTSITDKTLASFKTFLDEREFDYQEEADTRIQELRQIAESSHYSAEVMADLDLLANALRKEKARGFERYKNHIRRELDIALMAWLRGEQGRVKASLTGDTQLEAAIGLLKKPQLYAKKIGR